MRLIDADALKYRRKDYGSYDDVGDDERKRGILFLLKEDIAAAPTIDTVKHGKWNVIKKRPMDEEERREWNERLGYDIEYEDAFIYTNLPDDGEAVLTCNRWGSVVIDTFRDDDGCYFEDNEDMDGIIAWMPLPEPYKEETK